MYNILYEREINDEGGYIGSVDISMNGKLIVYASSNNNVKIWNLEKEMVEHTLIGHNGSITRVIFVHNENNVTHVISGSKDGQIKIWKTPNMECVMTLDNDGRVECIFVSRCGKKIISGIDNNIMIWNFENGQLLNILTGHIGYVHTIGYVSSGENGILSGSSDGTIKLWNMTDLIKEDNDMIEVNDVSHVDDLSLKTFIGHERGITSIAVGNDKTHFFSCCVNAIKHWNIANNICLCTIRMDYFLIRDIVLSPDGLMLIGASRYNNQIKCWDTSSGKCFLTLDEHTDNAYSPSLSADGMTMIHRYGKSGISLWKLHKNTLAQNDLKIY